MNNLDPKTRHNVNKDQKKLLSNDKKDSILGAAFKMEREAALIQGKGFGTSTIEEECIIVCKLLGKDPQLCVDIGANIGDYSFELIKKFPCLEIHLFEPSSVNVSKLGKRFEHQNRVHIIKKAISDNNSTATLFSNSPGSGLASLHKRKLDHFEISLDFEESVSTIRFEDYWLTILSEREVDLVKIDIEGHEFRGLQGFGKSIQKIKLIQFEFGGTNIDSRTFFQDFFYFFQERNFDIYRITPVGEQKIKFYSEFDECFVTTNYIAKNRLLA